MTKRSFFDPYKIFDIAYNITKTNATWSQTFSITDTHCVNHKYMNFLTIFLKCCLQITNLKKCS